MLCLSLPRFDERGRGAPAACADLIRADPALVPMIESLAVRGQFCIRCKQQSERTAVACVLSGLALSEGGVGLGIWATNLSG